MTRMDDAISRSAVLAIINDRSYDTAYPSEHDELVSEINKIPALDVVPVVRCKDCIHAVDITNWRYAKRFGDNANQCMRCRGDSGFGYYDLSVVYPDGFCDEGEKRND